MSDAILKHNPGRVPENLTAVVTGAGSGVGAVVARDLGARSLKIALVGRRVERLAQVQEHIVAAGGIAASFPCDVADPAQVESMAGQVRAKWGDPQVLFNSAGVHCELVPIVESDPESWINTLQANLVGTYLTCRAFMGGMVRQGWGRIINVTSASSLSPPGGVGSIYQLSKVAVNHFTRQLASELAEMGVTANVLHPGEVKSEMWASIKADASSRLGPGRNALGWADWVESTGGDPPEKSSEVVLRLLSPAGDTINGQFLWIEGGLQEPKPSW